MLPKCRCVDLIVKPYQVYLYPGLGAPGRHGPQSGYNICNSTTVGIGYLDFFPGFSACAFLEFRKDRIRSVRLRG